MIYLCLWGVLFIATAFNPAERFPWMLENGLTILGIGFLILTRNSLPFSRISYTLIFIYTCLHTIGAYYTYSFVPYNQWSQNLFGSSVNEWFGWERNNYDRLIHFLYGFLLAYPIREFILRITSLRGFWGYFLPFDVTMSTSMLYELIEWGAAVLFGAGSAAYIGSQGDVWDAQKDMSLATIGALISMGITLLINMKTQPNFKREFRDSIRLKRHQPYGEDELAHKMQAKAEMNKRKTKDQP